MRSIISILLLVSAFQSAAQTDSIKLRLHAYLQAQEATGKFRGSVLVAHSDTILVHQGYGPADDELQIANHAQTPYLIGSVTKTFTAVLILQLVQEQKLALEDTLDKFVPGLDNGDKITIHHLLTHTSGLPDYHQLDDWKELATAQWPPGKLIREVNDRLEPDFEPGERFRYCNTGYILLGLILEQVEGKPFAEILDQRIVKPLHLMQTGARDDYEHVPRMAKGYQSRVRETLEAERIHLMQPFASGNMYATTADLHRFMLALSRSALLHADMINQMFSGHTFGHYGYGIGIRHQADTFYGHTGRMNGFLATMNWRPAGDLFVLIIANDEYAPIHGMTEDVFAILSGQPYEMPLPRIPIELSDADAERLVGSYVIREGDTLHVRYRDHRFFMQETGQQELEIYPETKDTFFFDQLETNVVFQDAANGKLNTLILRQRRRDIVAKRIGRPDQ